MASHFNRPPNWPLPQGWTPPSGWTPDPSWPAAPPGWRLWIDDTETAAEEFGSVDAARQLDRETRPCRRRALLVGTLAAVLIVVAGITIGVLCSDNSSPAAQRPQSMLTGTYPIAPVAAWSVDADSGVHDGTSAHFLDPSFGTDIPDANGAVIAAGHVVAFIGSPMGSGQRELSSFNLSNGTLEWSVSSGPLACARDLLDGGWPCIVVTSSQQSTLVFIDANSGATTSSASVPFDARMIATDGRSLYTAGYVSRPDLGPKAMVVTKGSRQNPTAGWKTAVRLGDCSTHGTFSSLRVDHGLVWGSYGGGAYAVLRADDGSAVFDHPMTSVSVAEDGSRITAVRCVLNKEAATLPTDVFDGQGKQLFSAQTAVREPSLQAYAGGPAPLVNQDGQGLDPTTGAELWRAEFAPDGKNEGRSLVGNVMVGGVADGVTAIDIGTGERLWSWTRPQGHYGFSKLTDGAHLLLSNDNGDIDAVNLADGTLAWSADGVAGEPPQLYATSEGLLTVSHSRIQLLRPTGAAAAVPPLSGSLRDAAATKLVTKCGRAPEFRPESVRTDNGELVIRMRIVAHCPSGDVLSGSQTKLTVTSSGAPLASGSFDLSTNPIVVLPNSGGSSSDPVVEHEFRFLPGTWDPGFGRQGANGAASSQSGFELDATTLMVTCDQDASASQRASASGPSRSSHTATGAVRTPEPQTVTGPVTFEVMRDFVVAYYGELPANVDDAWSKLDPHLGERNGHQDYLDWWSGVQSVSVLSISPRDDTSVLARLDYHLRDGSTKSELRWLSFVADGGVLRIYDSDALP
jgi:outer membrane protein assembly factor BamB